MDIRDKVVSKVVIETGFSNYLCMFYSLVALPIYYMICRSILRYFIVSASIAIINEIFHSRLLYICACKGSDTADMLCPANRIGLLVIPAYQASVRHRTSNFSVSSDCITFILLFSVAYSHSHRHTEQQSKMAPYVEEFEESLAVSSKVPPSLVAPEPGTHAQNHCHNIHTLTLSRTLPRS
jgi:hypothetical protein